MDTHYKEKSVQYCGENIIPHLIKINYVTIFKETDTC
jgi:hypothetical protein